MEGIEGDDAALFRAVPGDGIVARVGHGKDTCGVGVQEIFRGDILFHGLVFSA